MHRITAQVLGVVVGLLALVGLFIEGELLLGIMNVDVALDILRAVLAVALIAVGFSTVPTSARQTVILVTGVLYVGLGLVAFADRTVFGLLPTGLTGFDIGFHLVVGIAAIVIAVMPDRRQNTASNTAPSARTER